MSTPIYVGVAHDLCLFDRSQVEFDEKLRKYFLVDPESQPVRVIPKGMMLSGKSSQVEGTPVDGVPVYQNSWTGVDEIPSEALEAAAIVVTPLYVAAWRETHKGEALPQFYGVANPVCVRSENNTTKVVGCLGIQPF